jgi:hypothetical protein
MFPDSVNVISTVELSVRGRAIWAKNSRGPFWIEPFLGVVRISETIDAIVSYDLKFADASRELARFRYGRHLRKADWFFPEEWYSRFQRESLRRNSAVRLASWHFLVSQNVHRLTIQAVRVTVDDLEILSIPHLPFDGGGRGKTVR